MEKPKRIILHWTAGGPTATSHDLRHYHWLCQRNGTIVNGVSLEKNLRQLKPWHEYAAHTWRFNSWSAGFAYCGMMDAKQGGTMGPYPIVKSQVLIGCDFIAQKMSEWDIEVTEDTVFTHWEAQEIHGVRQRGKWDITVLPWAPNIKEDEVGPWLRSHIQKYKDEYLNGEL